MDDVLDLSRAQFALNIGFHILFPALTIALSWILVYFRVRLARTGDPSWRAAYRLWSKVFALSFAMGVVSGVVMSFQFGTNWPGYMRRVGNVAGPLLAYEVLTAFFLEATFLGVMLFGMRRVSTAVHLASTVLVAAGTTLSAFWILALSSWMQTPAGHEVVDGVLVAGDWMRVVLNPSFPYRLAHMLIASGLTAAFVVAGLSAWRLLHSRDDVAALRALRTGIAIAALLAPVQLVVGDLHGLNTLAHQPAKIAAIEAIWTTEAGVPLVLFGVPDETVRETRYAVAIPRGASVILAHDPGATLQGLDAFAPDHPPVLPVFIAFRLMVGIGVAMIALAWATAWSLRRGRIPSRAALVVLAAFTFSGWIATLAGWTVTEVGRQPWLVSGILRTAEAVGRVPESSVRASFGGYLLTYALMLVAYLVVLTHLAGRGDAGGDGETPPVDARAAAARLAAGRA